MEQLAFEEPQPHRGNAKVALLVDGDNIPSTFAGQMLVRAGRLGQVIVKRTYVDPQHAKNWEESAGFGLCLARSGRNAADLLLVLDAVDLAHRGDLGAFVIASSDGGFASLGRYLVERGLTVLGLGSASAPADWRKSCTRFETLGERQAQARAVPLIPPPTEGEPDTGTEALRGMASPSTPAMAASSPASDQLIHKAVLEIVRAEGDLGLRLSSLGTRMREHGLDKTHLPEGSWLKYLMARPQFYRISGAAAGLSVVT